jgi:hypothetical protein
MIVELYINEDGTQQTMIPSDSPQKDFLTKDVDDNQMIWFMSFEVKDFEEACRITNRLFDANIMFDFTKQIVKK